MPERNKLTDLEVRRISKPGLHGDGGGLYLQITPRGSRSWLLRFQRDGRARAMGLGPVELVPLKDAREKARSARRLLLEGQDPIDARRDQRTQRRLEAAKSITFKMAAERYIASHRASWKSAKHAGQWSATLTTYCFPLIGELPVAAVDTQLVMKILEPLWTEKPETASRVRGRMESVLDWAAAREYRPAFNPARYKGLLDKLLPRTRKIARTRHHPALAYADLPKFFAELGEGVGISRQALKFLILTAARTNEVIGARWSEIRLDGEIRLADGTSRPCPMWVVPAERMKSGREHRSPLPPAAIGILKSVPRMEGCDYIFPGARAGKPLSSMALLELMRGMRPGYVPHGLRSSYRDWVLEASSFPGEAAEAQLAHVSGSATERAYKRGDAMSRRQDLQNAWAAFVTGAANGCSTHLTI
jgi:integrase